MHLVSLKVVVDLRAVPLHALGPDRNLAKVSAASQLRKLPRWAEQAELPELRRDTI